MVIEECIPLEAELSVLVARGTNGDVTTWDPVENIHRNHILDLSILPARLPEKILAQAKEVALAISETLQYVGVLAVEYFLAKDGRLVVNELAPRPHNSGHHTIDACETSQFEQQARAILNLPLGSTRLISPTVMMNLLEDDGSIQILHPTGLPYSRLQVLPFIYTERSSQRKENGAPYYLGNRP